MPQPFNVLIIHYRNYLSIPRVLKVLHQAGCQIHLFACKQIHASKSGYLHRFYEAPGEMSSFISALQEFMEARGNEFHWVITVDDAVLLELSKRLHEPWVKPCLPVKPSPEIMDFLMSKFAFPLVAAQHGIPVPKSRMVQTLSEATDAAKQFGYPLVAKSKTSVAGSGIHIANSEEELACLFEHSDNHELLLQEFVQGPVGGVTALYDQGRLLCWAAFLKVKTFPGDFGPAAVIRFVDMPSLEPILAKLGWITGYHGIGGVDFIYNAYTNRTVLLEQHARPTIQIYYANKVDKAFETCIRKMRSGHQDAAVSQCPPQNRLIYLFPQDLRRCFIDEDIHGLLGWVFSIRRWLDIPWNEPRLCLSYFRVVLSSLKKMVPTDRTF